MDKIDREIIELLRHNARLSYRELGERVFLSPNSVADRVRKLVADKVLLGFGARVNLAALDLPLQALIDVKMRADTTASHFSAVIQSIPGIVEATLMTGTYDYLLRVACRDQEDLARLIEALRSRAGVQETYSRIILRDMDMQARLAR
jgi:Lrp/AsnC family transcriptional regulator, leucine-responsive regulatory protein